MIAAIFVFSSYVLKVPSEQWRQWGASFRFIKNKLQLWSQYTFLEYLEARRDALSYSAPTDVSDIFSSRC